MTQSIYWYDLETTGTDPAHDRAIQFSGIRTNYDLKPLGDPQNFLCRPGDDVMPGVEAMLVTGILMQDLMTRGDMECEFARKIVAAFSQAETCVAGYNNLRFDDEFIRHTLYRNFYDPYSREWRGGNSRWDVIDLFRSAYALRPDGLNWPMKDAGGESGPSFKLEDLTSANQVEHLDAHDALSDVRATISMARLLKARQPRLYDYMFTLRDKQVVLKQLYPLGKSAVVHVSSMYPAARGCAAIVLPLCGHPTNNNGIICFDLSATPDAMLSATADELVRLVFGKAGTLVSETGEPEERVALKVIHINKCPAIAPLATLGDSEATRLGLDHALCEETMRRLQQSSGLVEKIQTAFSSRTFADSDDPDEMLYSGGFFPDADRSVMDELSGASSDDLPGFAGRFRDERLDEMLFRYRARNYPGTLTPTELTQWNQYRQARWTRGGDTIARVLEEIATRKQALTHADHRDLQVLDDLEGYITTTIAAASTPGTDAPDRRRGQ